MPISRGPGAAARFRFTICHSLEDACLGEALRIIAFVQITWLCSRRSSGKQSGPSGKTGAWTFLLSETPDRSGVTIGLRPTLQSWPTGVSTLRTGARALEA